MILLLLTYLDQTSSLYTNPTTDRHDFTDKPLQTTDERIQLTDIQTDKYDKELEKTPEESKNVENLDDLVELQLKNNAPVTEIFEDESNSTKINSTYPANDLEKKKEVNITQAPQEMNKNITFIEQITNDFIVNWSEDLDKLEATTSFSNQETTKYSEEKIINKTKNEEKKKPVASNLEGGETKESTENNKEKILSKTKNKEEQGSVVPNLQEDEPQKVPQTFSSINSNSSLHKYVQISSSNQKNSTETNITNFQQTENSTLSNSTEELLQISPNEKIESLLPSNYTSFDDLPIEEENFDRHMPVLADDQDDNNERIEHRVNLGAENILSENQEPPERREVEDAVEFGLRKMHELVMIKEPELYKKGE